MVISFLDKNLLPMTESLEPVAALMPHYYYERSPLIISEGVSVGNSLILMGAAGVFLLLAIAAFSQCNLTTGLW